MRKLTIAAVTMICAFLAVVPGGVSSAAAQSTLTSAEAKGIEVAWNNMRQATSDLVVVSPDVKGDTAKLEGHLKAAVNYLRQTDTKKFPATNFYPGYDKSRPREQVFNAVQGHLDAAKKAIQESGAKGENVQEAMANIEQASAELTIDRNTPVATPAAKTATKTAAKTAAKPK